MTDAIFWEWVSMAIRWLHVIAGIAWIGSSFYFIGLDLSLKRREGLPEGAGGETWQVHGGGFYNMVKYMVAPARMPEELTWFKWEAYTTWLSGMALLIVVYYMAADLYMIDPAVMDLSPWMAITISLVGLAAGWLIYDGLCRSPLGKNDVALAGVGFIFLIVLAYIFAQIFSGRGAFTQMGVIVGSMMVGNVFFIIIPNQRKVVADLIAGKDPDPSLGVAAKQRSLHNNYLTLPVVFVMIAGHYPLVFASAYGWLIFAVVLVMGAFIRHFFNEKHKGNPAPWWTWGVATACMIAIVWLSAQTAPRQVEAAAFEGHEPAEVGEIVQNRCSMCHAAEPVWEGITVAPRGVILETPDQIHRNANAIAMQSVLT
ncbi:MAG: urate hydroxylase PuuD, partial [Pseudomonadota bacterium]